MHEMKPAPFKLHKTKTVDEAVRILSEVCDDGGLVIAGGQSLVPMMALRAAYPPHLVDINGIPELSEIAEDAGVLKIGATVRHARFHFPVTENCLGDMLAEVSRNIAHYPIRMRGTFCGSLAHADPSSEWCLVVTAMDAEIHLASQDGARSVPAASYFDGAMMTVKEPHEIIVGVTMPLLPDDATFGFYEFNRRAGDFAIGMALVTWVIRDGVIAESRIAIGGIEENPRRLAVAEAVLDGNPPSSGLFEEAARLAAADVDPMDDATTSADYRRNLTAVVVRRALAASRDRLQAKLDDRA
jgi:aerobic carbon-monoxide dehydrogenase medium subunit